MEGKMKVAVMLGIGKMGFEERDIPKAKDDEVWILSYGDLFRSVASLLPEYVVS